jgi:tRNA (Thr-GGU) A37 N-methylase
MTSYEVRPIGHVRSDRDAAIDDDWDAVGARIELDPDVVDLDATDGLASFSHVEVLFLFDRVDPDGVCRGSRHPRGNTSWPRVGILAQRAKDRPNRLGSTTCALLEVGPGWLRLQGLDAIDGTPVLDIKPCMRGFAPRGEVREPAWAGELMSGYW